MAKGNWVCTMGSLASVKTFYRLHNATHIEEEHIYISDERLRDEADEISCRRYDGEPSIASRFDAPDLGSVLPLIEACVTARRSAIEKWLNSKDDRNKPKEIWFDFGRRIGTAIVKELGYKEFEDTVLQMVLLPAGELQRKAGILFWIQTAYTYRSPEEEKRIYYEMDAMHGEE